MRCCVCSGFGSERREIQDLLPRREVRCLLHNANEAVELEGRKSDIWMRSSGGRERRVLVPSLKHAQRRFDDKSSCFVHCTECVFDSISCPLFLSQQKCGWISSLGQYIQSEAALVEQD